jgi:hypothetical protein
MRIDEPYSIASQPHIRRATSLCFQRTMFSRTSVSVQLADRGARLLPPRQLDRAASGPRALRRAPPPRRDGWTAPAGETDSVREAKRSKPMPTTMSINDRKDLFSRAYVRAVASVAGYTATVPELDRDSVDLQLAGVGGGGTIRSPYLDLQLKCTGAEELSPTDFPLPLKIKNYDDLRATDLAVPRILVVVVVPPDIDDWLAVSEDQMIVRNCGYWHSLHGEPESENATTVTVRIDRERIFDVAGLQTLMQTVAAGGKP